MQVRGCARSSLCFSGEEKILVATAILNWAFVIVVCWSMGTVWKVYGSALAERKRAKCCLECGEVDERRCWSIVESLCAVKMLKILA